MEIIFLGSGEACDELNPNTSILVASRQGNCQFLLDCGFTTPHLYFAKEKDPERLDAVWISHFHGDHFFGIPLLILRFWEMGRRKTLRILGGKGIQSTIHDALNLAYGNFYKDLEFAMEFIEVEPGLPVSAVGGSWQSAENEHSSPSLSIKLTSAGKSIFYSGDGRPTSQSLELARGSDLVIHEAFRLNGETPGHGSIAGCLDFATRAAVPRLALVHVNRLERHNKRFAIQEKINNIKDVDVFLPEPGDAIDI